MDNESLISFPGTMHSEFSSIRLRNHRFPSQEWTAINDRDFKYAGEGKDLAEASDRSGASQRSSHCFGCDRDCACGKLAS